MAPEYRLIAAEPALFDAARAVYTPTYDPTFSWDAEVAFCRENGYTGYWLLRDGVRMGGAASRPGCITFPFMIPPFADREAFWHALLPLLHMLPGCEKGDIRLLYLAEEDVHILGKMGLRFIRAQRCMIRPTEILSAEAPDGILLETPSASDIPAIGFVSHQAHLRGYTCSVLGPWTQEEAESAIRRRYEAFSSTGTWGYSTVARDTSTGSIAGVCIAGIYPDSPHRFATVHQVSVLPDRQHRGIASAMLRRTVSLAAADSPAVTLGVMAGNPAQRVYERAGFTPGPAYTEMLLSAD